MEEHMEGKGLDFKHKEVININTGKRMGFVQDVCANLETGAITSIIVPGENKTNLIFDVLIPSQDEIEHQLLKKKIKQLQCLKVV